MSVVNKVDTFKVCLVFASLFYNALGQSDSEESFDDRVVGGMPAPTGFIPYQASLRDSSNRHYCGGSIISEHWILTAGHCVQYMKPSVIVVGTTKRSEGGDKYAVAEATIHPEYNSDNITNDIALVKTKEPIVFNDIVKVISLPKSDTPAGDELILSGWGRTSYPGTLPEDLQYLSLSSLEFNRCAVLLSPYNPVTTKQICTFTPVGEGACHGDSGGPLATASRENVVGIVSWGYPCARGLPDVYTRVFSYKEWINSTLSG